MNPPSTITYLHTPLTATAVRELHAGGAIRITGKIYTARDRVHRRLFDGGRCPVSLEGAALYHCGPIVIPTGFGGWRVTAAGPTTSNRAEPYMARILAQHGIRCILGKGGMGAQTLEACRRLGCVYVQLAGGAAASLARCIQQVQPAGFLDEFGATEAMWAFEVVDLPGIVTMDTHGNNLHDTIREQSRHELNRLLEADPQPAQPPATPIRSSREASN